MTDISTTSSELELSSKGGGSSKTSLKHLKSGSRTDSFDKFVSDEVMIALAMMKVNSLNSLSEKQRERAMKLRAGINAGGSHALGGNGASGVKEEGFNVEGWRVTPVVYEDKVLPLEITHAIVAPLGGNRDSHKKLNNLKDSSSSFASSQRDSGSRIRASFCGRKDTNGKSHTANNTRNKVIEDCNFESEMANSDYTKQSDYSDHPTKDLDRTSLQVHNSSALSVNENQSFLEPLSSLQSTLKNMDNTDISNISPFSIAEDDGKCKSDSVMAEDKAVAETDKNTTVKRHKNSKMHIGNYDFDFGSSRTQSLSKLNKGRTVLEGHPLELPPLQDPPEKFHPTRKKFPGRWKMNTVDVVDFTDSSKSPFSRAHTPEGNPAEKSNTNSYLQHLRVNSGNKNRTNWNTILNDARKIDGYRKIHAEKRKREKEATPNPFLRNMQASGYLDQHLRALSREAVITTPHTEHRPRILPSLTPLPPDWSFSSTVNLACKLHGSYPFAGKDKDPSNQMSSLSSLSEWTNYRGCQQPAASATKIAKKTHTRQTPLQYSKVQLSLVPEPQDAGNLSAHRGRDAAFRDEQRHYYKL